MGITGYKIATDYLIDEIEEILIKLEQDGLDNEYEHEIKDSFSKKV